MCTFVRFWESWLEQLIMPSRRNINERANPKAYYQLQVDFPEMPATI